MSDEAVATALPIFPLEGALLLPGGHLPLHIFEPRYRRMVDAALGQGRIIGMIQPRRAYAHPLPDDAEIFEIGCAGRIVSFSETDDGRYLITLRGISRFRVAGELAMVAGFRQVRADFSPFFRDVQEAGDEGIDRTRLLVVARAYFRAKALNCDWPAIEGSGSAALVTALAMICPFTSGEKQALLECDSVATRAALLVSLFEMAVLEVDGPPATIRH